MRFRVWRVSALVACGLVAANIAVVLGIAISSRHEALTWPGSSFHFWPERDWRSFERRVDALARSPRVQRDVIATVSYSQGSLPIYVLRFSPDPPSHRALKVLLVSGVHGTETAGVEALLRLSERMARGAGGPSTADLTIVPLANPWAWVYGYRYDGEGEDVNRDFASGRTQEASALRAFMKRNGPWDLFLDLHESKKPGYFIYQYLPEDEGLGAEYVKILTSMGRPVENTYEEWPFRVHKGRLIVPAPMLAWVAIAGRLSQEQYVRLHGTRHSYTVETPLSDDAEARVAVHMRTAETFIDRLSMENAGR